MSGLKSPCRAAALLVLVMGAANVQADHRAATLAVIMTNDPVSNQIKVYDVGANVLLQTLSTHGMGSVGGNARGVKQYNGEIVAVVSNGSNSVALYKRHGKCLAFDKLVTTTSPPVSVDFGNDHMYVAGGDDGRFIHRRQARSRRLAFPSIPMAPLSSPSRTPTRTDCFAMARSGRSSAPARRRPVG